eukprot:scaffold123695_cov57-Phaeocystis_antarctica.AAC.1
MEAAWPRTWSTTKPNPNYLPNHLTNHLLTRLVDDEAQRRHEQPQHGCVAVVGIAAHRGRVRLQRSIGVGTAL